MSRYVVLLRARRPRGDADAAPAPALPHPQVFVAEPIKTGLLDAMGRDIYRLPDEIGYLRKKQS